MLYTVLCYSDEAVTTAWSKEEDDAVMTRLGDGRTKYRAVARHWT